MVNLIFASRRNNLQEVWYSVNNDLLTFAMLDYKKHIIRRLVFPKNALLSFLLKYVYYEIPVPLRVFSNPHFPEKVFLSKSVEELRLRPRFTDRTLYRKDTALY